MGCSAREWQAEVEALKRSRDDLQRASLQVAEEVRAIRMQSDRQKSELSALGSELRSRAQTLDDSFRQQVCQTANYFQCCSRSASTVFTVNVQSLKANTLIAMKN